MSTGTDWDTIQADPEFQAQPLAVRNRVALNFFEKRIAPVSDDIERDRYEFFSEAFKPPELPEKISIPGQFGRGAVSGLTLGGVSKGEEAISTWPQAIAREAGETIGMLPAMAATEGFVSPATEKLGITALGPVAAKAIKGMVTGGILGAGQAEATTRGAATLPEVARAAGMGALTVGGAEAGIGGAKAAAAGTFLEKPIPGLTALEKIISSRYATAKTKIDSEIKLLKQFKAKRLPSAQVVGPLKIIPSTIETLANRTPGGQVALRAHLAENARGLFEARDSMLRDITPIKDPMALTKSISEHLADAQEKIDAKVERLVAEKKLSLETARDFKKQASMQQAMDAREMLKSKFVPGSQPYQTEVAAKAEAGLRRHIAEVEASNLWESFWKDIPKELDRAGDKNLRDASAKGLAESAIAGFKGGNLRRVMATLQEGPPSATAQVDIENALQEGGFSPDKAKEFAESVKNLRDKGIRQIVGPTGQNIPIPATSEEPYYTIRQLHRMKGYYYANAKGVEGEQKIFWNRLAVAAEADRDEAIEKVAKARPDLNLTDRYKMNKFLTREEKGLTSFQFLKGLFKREPSPIVRRVMRAGNEEQTKILKQALGGDDTALKLLRGAAIDDIFGPPGSPMPSKLILAKSLAQHGPVLNVLFPKDAVDELTKLTEERGKLGPEIQKAYDKHVVEANAAYRKGKRGLIEKGIAKAAAAMPDELIHAVQSYNEPVVSALRRTLPPSEFEYYQQISLRDLMGDPKLVSDAQLSAIRQRLSDHEQFYREMLGDEKYNRAMKIGTAADLLPGFKDLEKSMTGAQKAIGTIGMAAGFGLVGGIAHIFVNPTVAAIAGLTGLFFAYTIGSETLTNMLLSDTGTKLITTLCNLPANDIRAGYITQQMAKAGILQKVSTGNMLANTQPQK